MAMFTVLIHWVQFKFIMLNTLHEDFIFYLQFHVLSETLIFTKKEKHKTGWNLTFLIILYQSSPTMSWAAQKSLILEHLIIYGRLWSEGKGMLSMLFITAIFIMIQ